MESNIVLLALKFALLALVWLFVLAAVVGMGKSFSFAPTTGGGGGRSKKQPTEMVVLTGPHAGTNHQLSAEGTQTVIIGRDRDCQVSLPQDGFISQQHLQLTREASGRWSARDLNSQNGTIIYPAPGQTLAGSRPVTAGTEFLIGESLVRLT
ncbi:FHA domain-containing protein [Corynebacterium mendelii]|uniref:FHA domain-containing protein n=1 Tax=Corynebacterium mendelii TaxID=2765362 RepID=A0A939E0S7_9CORY|nr:FHA domain-containing protein [Corynebacterium mendelii]MBN9644336.1 FHA domain-containing protein [Corynebacterium mendelii]